MFQSKHLNSCADPLTGQLLQKFDDVWTARIEQARRWFFYSTALRVDLCVSCKGYHLLPELDQPEMERSFCGFCKSKYGANKIAHTSSVHANTEKNTLTSRSGLGTRIYPCPYGNGWHVTSNIDYNLFKAVSALDAIRADEKRKNSNPVDSIGEVSVKNNTTLKLKRREASSTNEPSQNLKRQEAGGNYQTTDASISDRRAPIFVYKITPSDQLRIRSIIGNSKNLKNRSDLNNKEDLMIWAKTKNPFEAYFLAAYLRVDHPPPIFSDPTLLAKLDAWIAWAKEYI
jgi:hypothetical protein